MLSHDEIQAAISARLDGEETHVANDVIDAHLEACPECSAFQRRALLLSRTLRVAESPSIGMAPPSDLSEIILAGVEPEWKAVSSARHATLSVLRIAAVVLGLLFIYWAVKLVMGASGMLIWSGDGQTLSPQAAPETAALTMQAAALRLGLASGLFFSAWRPALAPGMLPIVTTMFMFLSGFAMRDIALDRLGMESVLTLVGLALTIIVLAWMWATDKGLLVRSMWHQFSANPR